jgi:hypothetical protein
MNIFNFLKGGKNKMVRNLVKENNDADTIRNAVEEKAIVEDKKEVVVITEQQLIINNLQLINQEIADIKEKLIIGFKEVGVKF